MKGQIFWGRHPLMFICLLFIPDPQKHHLLLFPGLPASVSFCPSVSACILPSVQHWCVSTLIGICKHVYWNARLLLQLLSTMQQTWSRAACWAHVKHFVIGIMMSWLSECQETIGIGFPVLFIVNTVLSALFAGFLHASESGWQDSGSYGSASSSCGRAHWWQPERRTFAGQFLIRGTCNMTTGGNETQEHLQVRLYVCTQGIYIENLI